MFRLFAATFHEMIKLDKADSIIAWLQDYKAKHTEEVEARETKKKRDFEHIAERTKIFAERTVKRQKREMVVPCLLPFLPLCPPASFSVTIRCSDSRPRKACCSLDQLYGKW